VFRRGGDVSFVVDELKAIFDPRGGQWMSGRYVPSLLAAIGEVVAERVRSRFAAQHGGEHYGEHYNDPGVTGSIRVKGAPHPLGYTGEDDDRLPVAEPGED